VGSQTREELRNEENGGDFIVVNGKRLNLKHHATDFSVISPEFAIRGELKRDAQRTQPLTDRITRFRARDPRERDELMTKVRREKVAHHIYTVQDTDEEIVIDDRIIVELRVDNPDQIEKIMQDFHLESAGRMGSAYILRVTEATRMNPLKVANEIAKRGLVESCTPHVLAPMMRHAGLADTHRLFARQWYLSSDLMDHADLRPDAGIQIAEAWAITRGSEDIVIAVIDDGFDLGHPAFANKRIHLAAKDFAVAPSDSDPLAGSEDYHGTCVASIATGSGEDGAMLGVAPGCTFLPIRIGFGPFAPVIDMLEVFRYASQHADVVNCSFGTSPLSFDPFPPSFREEIAQLTVNGGRRGLGLVMVFSAANDDAPTLLPRSQNINGVRFVNSSGLRQVPPRSDVFSGYPLTRGVVVVAAMSSLKRKSGYSCWGPHITVTAPSNNMHYIMEFVPPGFNDAIRDQFLANYRGLGQVAASNRPGFGADFLPLPDDPATLGFREDFYTADFGGTSGAAPIVSGVAALMLSIHPDLSAEQVRQILMATADRDLDASLDLAADPNLQGLTGEFVNGRSLFFGSGKVNAARAVARAQALLDGTPATFARLDGRRRDHRTVPTLRAPLEGTGGVLLWPADARRGSNGTIVWRLRAAHADDITPRSARLLGIPARRGTVAEYKYAPDTSANSLGLHQFTIEVKEHPPYVGHAPYYTDLVLHGSGVDQRNIQVFLLLSERAVGQSSRPRPRVVAESDAAAVAIGVPGLSRDETSSPDRPVVPSVK
jgi:subtilisin family serine protease